MATLTQQEINQHLPFLQTAAWEVQQEAMQQMIVAQVPVGEIICWEGDTCGQLAIVLSGLVRVYKIGENGREITLYRIEENDSCILTASCILSEVKFPALAVVEQTVRVALIPAPVLRRWINQYDVWRNYVFGLLSYRLAGVIATIEEVAFRRVDVRIAEFLLKTADARGHLTITHQEIASELGTAREVVSRILKDFEREGVITLARGAVTIQNQTLLKTKLTS
ncbi:MAG: Crp/Fnr family transcriptional regulator [Anaerolineales bacterium]|nr:Crp/Fnr family transcriptional regulator [Anaerolineales bacterium]